VKEPPCLQNLKLSYLESKKEQEKTKNQQNFSTNPLVNSQFKYILCDEPHLATEHKNYEGLSNIIKRIRELGRCEKCNCHHNMENCKFKLSKCSFIPSGFPLFFIF